MDENLESFVEIYDNNDLKEVRVTTTTNHFTANSLEYQQSEPENTADSISKFEMLKQQCVRQVSHVHKLTNELKICKGIIESFRYTKEKLSTLELTSGLPSKLNSILNMDEEYNKTQTLNESEKSYYQNKSPTKSEIQDYSKNLVRNIIVENGEKVTAGKTDFQSYISSQAQIIEKILKNNENEENNFKHDISNTLNSPFQNINIKQIDDIAKLKSPSISYNNLSSKGNATHLNNSFAYVFNEELSMKLKQQLDKFKDTTIDLISKEGYSAFESRLDNLLVTSKDVVDLTFLDAFINKPKIESEIFNNPRIEYETNVIVEYELNEEFDSLGKFNVNPNNKSVEKLNDSTEKMKGQMEQDTKLRETNYASNKESNSLIDVIQSGLKQNGSFFKTDKKYHNISSTSQDKDYQLLDKNYRSCKTCSSNTNELQNNLQLLAMKKIKQEKKKKDINDSIFAETLAQNKSRYFDESFLKELNKSYDSYNKNRDISISKNIKTAVKNKIETYNQTSEKKSPARNTRKSVNFIQKNCLAVSKNSDGTPATIIQRPKHYYTVKKETQKAEENLVPEKDYNLLDFFDSTSPHHPSYWTNIEMGKSKLHISPSKKERQSILNFTAQDSKKKFDFIQNNDLMDINRYQAES